MKIVRNNKGILLVIIFCVFIAGILLYNYLLNIMFTNKAEALVRDYIEKNMPDLLSRLMPVHLIYTMMYIE